MERSATHVVITGGSGGLSAAWGRGFAAARARVTLVARRAVPPHRAVPDASAAAVAADVRDPDRLLRLASCPNAMALSRPDHQTHTCAAPRPSLLASIRIENALHHRTHL